MKDYNATEITNPVDDLFVSVNDIYAMYDDGKINYNESQQILMRICKHFIAQQHEVGQVLDHKIYFERADDLWQWLEENQLTNPVTLTIHLGD